ncbi:MAG TPA: GNAT family N-acetyltransferase [Terriglobales bacterium]|nr:GNAT family N-acetyltransferase [Terriglobales bacterium]HZR63932.1 GNAT family N-acetyltransferase [Terriglobales bacterium]
MSAPVVENRSPAARKIIIRNADLNADRSVLVSCFYQFLTPLSDERRYDWLYRDNPDGPARVWIAHDPENGALVGSGSAIPRRFWMGGDEVLGCIFADFWIHPNYRSLGPALQLQRACMQSLDQGDYQFCIDFPKMSMVAVYRRLGVQPAEAMVRWAKPLRVDSKIGQKVKPAVLAKCLSAAGNRLLELSDRRFGRSKKFEIYTHEGPFGEEFTELGRTACCGYDFCVARNQSYLNWRYRNHFHQQYSTLVAREGSRLTGYLVMLRDGNYGQVIDLIGKPGHECLEMLLARAVSIFREQGIELMNAPMLPSDPAAQLFKHLGFYARESSPIVIYASSHGSYGHALPGKGKWFLMQGDRES